MLMKLALLGDRFADAIKLIINEYDADPNILNTVSRMEICLLTIMFLCNLNSGFVVFVLI